LSLKLSDTRVCEPQIRARLGATGGEVRQEGLAAEFREPLQHVLAKQTSRRGARPRDGRHRLLHLRGRRAFAQVFKAHRLLYHSTLGFRVIRGREEGLGCGVNLPSRSPPPRRQTPRHPPPRTERSRTGNVKRFQEGSYLRLIDVYVRLARQTPRRGAPRPRDGRHRLLHLRGRRALAQVILLLLLYSRYRS